MHRGYVALWRKLRDKGFYKKSTYVHLWVHLLLSANHKPKEHMTNGQIILIKEGQLIAGRKQLAKETGIPQSTVERILEMLENEHQIEQQKTTKYRLITILNWKDYQNRTSVRTASGQQADTNNNVNNVNKNPLASPKNEFEKSQAPFRLGGGNAVPEVPEVVNFDYNHQKFLKGLENSAKKIDRVIAWYWKKKGFKFETLSEAQLEYGRDSKVASKIVKAMFSPERVEKVARYCEVNYEKWSLETIVKMYHHV